MCGIAGIRFGEGNHADQVKKIVKLMEKTSLRGQDGYGIVSVKTGKYFKSKQLPTGEEPFFNLDFSGDIVILNARAQPMTEVASTDIESLQPILKDGYVLAHNGVVSNDVEICEKYGFDVTLDSEIIVDLLNLYTTDGTLRFESGTLGNKVLSQLSGGFAFALAKVGNTNELVLVKDFKTLWYGTDKNDFYFASEKQFLEEVFGKEGIFSRNRIENIEPYTVNYINFMEFEHKEIKFETKVISSLPPKNDNLVLVCASGGIDSSTSAYVAKKLEGKDVVMAFFDMGQKSAEREWESVQAIAEDLGAITKYIDIKWLGELGKSVLTDPSLPIPKSEKTNIKSTVCWTPARNLAMMSILVALAESIGASAIYNGWTLEEGGSYPDNSDEFFRTFNEMLPYGTLTRPEITMVLQRLMKTEIIQLGQYLGLDYSKTWSCDDGQAYHCGECGACFLHHYAFDMAGVEDPTLYIDFNPSYTPEWVQKGQTKPGNIRDIIKRLNIRG